LLFVVRSDGFLSLRNAEEESIPEIAQIKLVKDGEKLDFKEIICFNLTTLLIAKETNDVICVSKDIKTEKLDVIKRFDHTYSLRNLKMVDDCLIA